MYSSLRGSLRACTLRGLIAALPIAMICAYSPPSVVPTPPRLVAAQVQNVAEIVSAPSTIGIADSGLYGETQAQINQTLDTLQSIGVQDVRVFVPWIYVEPANGTYNWSSLDMVIQAAQARNMGVMAEVASTPLWEGSSNAIAGAGTPNPTDYASFVTSVAKRYGTAISAYEVWNEPNYVLSSDPIDPVAYAALLKAAYPAIKAVDPSATVVAGALGSVVTFGNITMDPTTFVSQMLAAGAAKYFDALSFHPYQESLPFSQGAGIANTPLSQLNAIYQLMTQYGDGLKKIWISEFGASTNDVSQQTQADLIKNLLDTWQTLGYAGPAFIYTAQDGVPGADGYGIYNADWTPKLAVAVIQQAIKQYSSGLLGTVGSTVGTVTSGVGAVAQSLASLLQSISLAIQGEFQQLGQAINAWFAAIAAQLSHTPPSTTPLAATTAAPLQTAAVTPKATTATTAAVATTATTPVTAKTSSTSTTTAAAPVTTAAVVATAATPVVAKTSSTSTTAAAAPVTAAVVATAATPVVTAAATPVVAKTSSTSTTAAAAPVTAAVAAPVTAAVVATAATPVVAKTSSTSTTAAAAPVTAGSTGTSNQSGGSTSATGTTGTKKAAHTG